MNSCCHPILCTSCFVLCTAFAKSKVPSTKLFQTRLPLRSRHVVVFRRLTAVDSITFADLLYVLTSFTIWGNVASVFHDRAFSGIITREHQIHATPEHGHQLLQITGAAHDVLGRIDRKSTRLNSSHLVFSYAVF